MFVIFLPVDYSETHRADVGAREIGGGKMEMPAGETRAGRKTQGVRIAEVRDRTDRLIDQLLAVWEGSVRATHDFLTNAEVERIKGYVPDALRGVERLVVARDAVAQGAANALLAFMGVRGDRLEMLFVEPATRGCGIGSALLRHGIEEMGVRELTVNEQNPAACGFYEHMGFVTYKRTDTDEEGGPYPLLYMRLP